MGMDRSKWKSRSLLIVIITFRTTAVNASLRAVGHIETVRQGPTPGRPFLKRMLPFRNVYPGGGLEHTLITGDAYHKSISPGGYRSVTSEY